METANCAYHLKCDCSANYTGQTKCNLKIKVKQHQQLSRDSAIYNHIIHCPEFKKNLSIFRKPNSEPCVTVKQLEIEKAQLSLSEDKVKMKFLESHQKIFGLKTPYGCGSFLHPNEYCKP
jgi:hypothetical protein